MAYEYKRLLKAPAISFFLLGMRGTGKSTWAKEYFKDAMFVDLLDEGLYQEILADISHVKRLFQTADAGQWIVIDEVQRLPNILNYVHREIEENSRKFVLLGSSARKLRKSGINLLGGRAMQKYMHGLLPQELEKDFDLGKVLETGSIPLIWTSPDPLEQLKAYVQLYLKEEIQAEALVRNLPGFARFLPVAALFHGQVLSIDGLARDAGVARTTVQGYLDILEDTLLAFRLPAYEGKLRVKERKHPKLYWKDPGVVRAVKRQYGKVGQEERGALLEGFIINTLIAYRDYGLLEFDDIYYWSGGKNSVEVDILLKKGERLIAVEVKSSKKVHKEHLKGLKAAAELKNIERSVLIYEGENILKTENNIDILPVTEFLRLAVAGLW